MVRNWLFGILCACGLMSAVAQSTDGSRFYVEVSTDSLLMDNPLQVTYRLENADGTEFSPPAFTGFAVVGGPNQSSSISIVNGSMSRSLSYSYYLEPLEVGTYHLESAVIKVEDSYLETEIKEIMVYPNPDGIRQALPAERSDRGMPGMRFFDDWPLLERPMTPLPPATPRPDSTKKKRKTKRI